MLPCKYFPCPLVKTLVSGFQLQSPLSLHPWGESRPKTSSSSTLLTIPLDLSCKKQGSREAIMLHKPGPSPTVHSHSHWTVLLPSPYEVFSVKLSTDSSSISDMQLGLQFATQYFCLSIAYRSGPTELSSMQFCIRTFLSWSTHHH